MNESLAKAATAMRDKDLPELPEKAPPIEVTKSEPTPEQTMTPEEWAIEFDLIMNNPPSEGEYLRTTDGSRIRLSVELSQGQQPFIYANAFVPKTVGSQLGWFVQGENDDSEFGWKTVLMPKSRDACIKKLGISSPRVYIRELRVVRLSATKKSILVEVSEW